MAEQKFENALGQLEEIVADLESGNLIWMMLLKNTKKE